jgi:hypothetical protein
MAIGPALVARRLGQVLSGLGRGVDDRTMTAVTALAEGSDRLFADAALERGWRLDVLLPLASEDYETTFSDASATPHYRALLARASQVTLLPGTLADRKAAYAAVGEATVAASDLLVAVWDGEPAAGRGGTPEIIAEALRRTKPVIWVDAARDRLPVLLRQPAAGGPRDLPLARLAGRARPLTRARIARLGTALDRELTAAGR